MKREENKTGFHEVDPPTCMYIVILNVDSDRVDYLHEIVKKCGFIF